MQEILKYQEIDSKLRKLEAELNGSQNRKNAQEMQQYLKDGQAKLIKLEEVSKNLNEQYLKATKLYNDYVAKLESLSKQVESVKDGKTQELETVIQNLFTTADNAKKARHNLEIYKASFAKEKEKVEPEIIRLREEKNKQRTKVDPKLLAKYNAKSEGKIFPIFVPETNSRCGGCRMEIPAGKLADLKNKGLIECENCGRLIYKV